MSELEQQLRELGATLFPAEPDIQAAVRARLAPRRRRPLVRPVLLFAALLLAALVAALAIPQARSALERWLGIGSARITHVQTLPRTITRPAATGYRVSAAEAERWIHHRLLRPPSLGKPTDMRLDHGRSVVVLVWGKPAQVRLMELDFGGGEIYLQKLVPPNVRVERVDVGGHRGYGISGRHAASFAFGQPELAGPVLLWARNGLTLRLDGRLTKPEALALARSTR
ncbi:MAG: hypothetical protein QOH73_107 [Gaiellaceae bacterium]|jgi:hypothetical protein|nr:hypothetical protein [Gaiellaceae bacterium]